MSNLISSDEGGVRETRKSHLHKDMRQHRHRPAGEARTPAGAERQVSLMPRLQEYEQAPDPHPILPLSNTTEFLVVLVF